MKYSSLYAHRELTWDLTQDYDCITIDKFGAHKAYQDGLAESITGHLSSKITKELPVREVPVRAKTFLSEFLAKGGQYPAKVFMMPGRIHPSGNMWWSRIVKYVLDTHKEILKEIGLYKAIRNIQFGLSQSSYHFFSLLEMYNPETSTFFTPVGELGFVLHEMFEVSKLSIRTINGRGAL